MDPLAEKVAQKINQLIDTDRLVLPTMPEMALKVREVSEDPDAGIYDLGKVISNDPALTARIIKVANSPIYRAPKEIQDLNMALGRLGMETTANLATGLAMEQMFQATSDIVDKRMRETWASSSEIAGICHVLCKHYTKLQPDQAALAGLTFQIGILPILSFAENNSSLLRDSITLDRIIEQVHPALGVRILSTWEFPQELCCVPETCRNYSADKDKADYADLVTVAMLQTLAGSQKVSDIDYAQVKAFARLGLDPEIESAEAEDLSEEMEAAMKLFN